MDNAVISLSVKVFLRRYPAESIAEQATVGVNQITMPPTQITMPGHYTHFRVPRYDKAGKEDPLFQPLLATLTSRKYTVDMKTTRINMIKHGVDYG